MTGKDRKEQRPLGRLADAFVEDVLNSSDSDILAEFKEFHGDPDINATRMRGLFEKCIVVTNKSKLSAAKAEIANRRLGRVSTASIDVAQARSLIRKLASTPGFPKLTLAARKETELSDADILGMLDDLRELGILDDDQNEGGKG